MPEQLEMDRTRPIVVQCRCLCLSRVSGVHKVRAFCYSSTDFHDSPSDPSFRNTPFRWDQSCFTNFLEDPFTSICLLLPSFTPTHPSTSTSQELSEILSLALSTHANLFSERKPASTISSTSVWWPIFSLRLSLMKDSTPLLQALLLNAFPRYGGLGPPLQLSLRSLVQSCPNHTLFKLQTPSQTMLLLWLQMSAGLEVSLFQLENGIFG